MDYSITSTSKTKILFFENSDINSDLEVSSYNILSQIMGKYSKSKIIILTESKIYNKYRYYIENLILKMKSLTSPDIFPIEEGDFFKNQEIVDKIINFMLNKSYDRSALVIGFGGGKITDLAGYIASIFLRGVDNILIPTNLLSMVDASVGGKTGINHLKYGKNLIGSIYQPKVILINLWILNDLEDDLISDGLSEIIKIFALFDKDMFYSLRKHSVASLKSTTNRDYFYTICKKASQYKISIIQKDETDKGIRNVLNFGHTIGHAVESVEALNLSHGKSVAIGLVTELEIAVGLGLTNEVTYRDMKEILENFSLPVEIPKYIDPSLLITKMRNDKKTAENKLKIVLIKEIGEVNLDKPVISLDFDLVGKIIARSVFIEHLNYISSSIPKKEIKLKGSKSICNRALILSALGSGQIYLKNFLFSEDTNIMIKCLRNLGVYIDIIDNNTVRVVGKEGKFEGIKATLYVENAGTAARFLTSLCGICKNSSIVIDGNARMRERPIGDLLDTLENQKGIQIEFLGGDGKNSSSAHKVMPFRIITSESIEKMHPSTSFSEINVKSKKSSQYVTSLLLSAPFFNNNKEDIVINLTDVKEDEKPVSYQYIDMTVKMMKIWGVNIEMAISGYNKFIIKKSLGDSSNIYINPKEYVIEPDASTANYYLTFTALHGGEVKIRDIGSNSIQGDAQFYKFLEKIQNSSFFACKQTEDSTILISKGISKEIYLSPVKFDEDISLITDSFLALGVILSQIPGEYNFRGLANQAIKECNRLELFALNLNKIGVFCSVHTDGIVINSKINRKNNISFVEISTANDHRMAMSFAILGSYLKNTKLYIDNKNCVNKTYPEFWRDFENIYGMKTSSELFNSNKSIFKLYRENYRNNPVFLIGMRGCGKSSLGKYAAEKLDLHFIDFDLLLLERNVNLGYKNINEIVEDKGWDYFRKLERELFFEVFTNSYDYSGTIIACGGGIVENTEIMQCLKSYSLVIFIDTHIDNVKAAFDLNMDKMNRPNYFTDLESVYYNRLEKYKYAANYTFKTPYINSDLLMNKTTISKICEIFTGFVYTTCNPMKYPLPDDPSYFLSIVFTEENMEEIMENLSKLDSYSYQAIEFRADKLVENYIENNLPYEEIVSKLAQIISKLRFVYYFNYIPVIFTIRSQKEGGFFGSGNKNKKNPYSLYNYINTEMVKFGIEYFDIEFNYDNINFINDFYKNSKSISNYRVILSKHYADDISVPQIKKDIYTMSLLNHDIAKIITNIQNYTHYEEIKTFINKYITKPVIHFQLGSENKLTRVLNTYLNPVYDTAIGTPTGSGQMTMNEIESVRELIGMRNKMEERAYNVIGASVSISPSPFIYETAYSYYFKNLPYLLERKNCATKEELYDIIFGDNKVALASITIPYKEEILSNFTNPNLQYTNILSEEARYINSVNLEKKISLIENNSGKIFCCNTDWIANYEIISEMLSKLKKNLSDIKILILGAGGASVATILSLFMINFDKRNIHIYNRSKDRAENVVKEYGIGMYIHTMNTYDIVISSVPRNADEDYLTELMHNNNLTKTTHCLDLAYMKDLTEQTNFRKIISENCPYENYYHGIDFLLRQGYYSFEIFSGKIAERRFIKQRMMASLKNDK